MMSTYKKLILNLGHKVSLHQIIELILMNIFQMIYLINNNFTYLLDPLSSNGKPDRPNNKRVIKIGLAIVKYPFK